MKPDKRNKSWNMRQQNTNAIKRSLKCTHQQLSTEEKESILNQNGLKNVDSQIHVCSKNEFRLSLKTTEEVQRMLKTIADEAHVMWRVFKTNPKDMAAGIKNIFYKEYVCQSSNVRILKQSKNVHKKHTDCQAKMRITVKRIGQRVRSKDSHLPEYPTRILFINDHNHYLNGIDNVKYSDVSELTKNKFLALFKAGHSVSSALDSHKIDLRDKYQDDYHLVASNRSICPEISWVYRLYEKFWKEECVQEA